MKLVCAYIKPHVLSDVTLALQMVDGFRGISVMPARGLGWKVRDSSDLIVSDGLEAFEHAVRIEILCEDEYVAGLVSAIRENARTGVPGDGITFVLDVVSVRRNADDGEGI